jgi:hypothetical protein
VIHVPVVLWLLCAASVAISLLGIYSLAAIWAARPTGHWFFRAVALLLLCGAWLLVPDYQLWLFFVTLSLGVQLSLKCFGWREGATQQMPIADGTTGSSLKLPRFTLADLLLAVVIVGVVFAIFMRAPADARAHWHRSVLPGLLLAAGVTFGVWLDSGRRPAANRARLRWNLGWLLALPIVWPLLPFIGLLWLMGLRCHHRLRSVAVLGMALWAAPALVFYGWAVWPRFLSRPTVPAENGYDDFVRAGELLLGDRADIRALSGGQLRDYLVKHQESLMLARAGMKRPCSVPWREDALDPKSLDGPRQLARLFVAEGRWYAAEGHLADAIQSDLDGIRIGQAIPMGGLLMDHLVGGAYELSGLDALHLLVGRLGDGDCARLANSLTALLSVNRESFDEIAWREQRHNDLTRPWTERLIYLQVAPQLAAGRAVERQNFEDQTNSIICRGRLLLAHIALRRYRLANHAYPTSLDELVLQYLDAVPVDPFSGKNLIYRRLEEGYQLYSIGPDGKDDGGTPISGTAIGALGDLLFDVPSESPDP